MEISGIRYLSEKNEYIGVDFFKLAGACLVVAIHIPPFADINPDLSDVFQQIFCRLAVPFFFLCSGFFLGDKGKHRESAVKYLRHITGMYVFFSLCYLPQMIERFWITDRSIMRNLLEMFRRFFLVGSYIQLWYLLATAVAVTGLYLCAGVVGLRDWNLAVLAAVLYIMGVFGNSYRLLFEHTPVIAEGIRQYLRLFITARNGIFFGFPMITAGYLIAEHKKEICRHSYWIWTAVFFLLMYLEVYLLKHVIGASSHDMYFLMPAVSVSLFLSILFISVPSGYAQMGKICRRLSTWIFLIHLLVNFYLKKIFHALGLSIGGSMEHYLSVTGISILVALILWQVPKKIRRIRLRLQDFFL